MAAHVSVGLLLAKVGQVPPNHIPPHGGGGTVSVWVDLLDPRVPDPKTRVAIIILPSKKKDTAKDIMGIIMGSGLCSLYVERKLRK